MENYKKSTTALILVDIQKPFYSNNKQIKESFPGKAHPWSVISIFIFLDFQKNIEEAINVARKNKMLIVHVRAVYNEQLSPWIKTFR